MSVQHPFGIGIHNKKAAFRYLEQNRVGGLGAGAFYTEQAPAQIRKIIANFLFSGFRGNGPGLDEKIL